MSGRAGGAVTPVSTWSPRTTTDSCGRSRPRRTTPTLPITKADVDTFLAESGRAVFSYRLLIATTDSCTTARRTIQDQEKQVAFFGLSDLLTVEVNWRTNPLDLRPSPPRESPLPSDISARRSTSGEGVRRSRIAVS